LQPQIELTEEGWLEKIKKERDPTEDHRMGLIALQNKIRREITKFIDVGSKKR